MILTISAVRLVLQKCPFPTSQACRFSVTLQHLVHDLLRADIMDVQLKNVQPPDEWKAAVAAKQKAQQDILLAFNERDQALAKVTAVSSMLCPSAAIIARWHAIRDRQAVKIWQGNSSFGRILLEHTPLKYRKQPWSARFSSAHLLQIPLTPRKNAHAP